MRRKGQDAGLLLVLQTGDEKRATVTPAMRVHWRNVPSKIVVRAASTVGILLVSCLHSVSVSVCGEPVRSNTVLQKSTAICKQHEE